MKSALGGRSRRHETGLGGRSRRCYLPAAGRWQRLAAVAGQQQAGDAAGFGGQLQAAGSGRLDLGDLAQDGGRGAAAQGLFHGPQGIHRPAGTDDDQAFGRQTKSGQAGSIKIAIAAAPQRGAMPAGQPRQKAGTEAAGGAVAAGNRMQATAWQAAARQVTVEARIAELHQP